MELQGDGAQDFFFPLCTSVFFHKLPHAFDFMRIYLVHVALRVT